MPPVAGQRVLIFGDSLSASSAAPGGVLARELTARGATVQINAKVGRSAWSFYNHEDHAAQLAAALAWKPDLVIVELGTNDIGLRDPTNPMADLRNSLRAGGADVWAIGPPSFAAGVRPGGDGMAVTMRDVFGADRFIDWRPLSKDQTSTGRIADQIHFTAAGAEIAGKRLATAFVDAGGGIGWVALGIVAALAWAVFG